MDDPKSLWQSIDWEANEPSDQWSTTAIRESLQSRSRSLFQQLRQALGRHVLYNGGIALLPVVLIAVDPFNWQWIFFMLLFFGYLAWLTLQVYQQYRKSQQLQDYSQVPIAIIRSVIDLILAHHKWNQKSLIVVLPFSVLLGASASMARDGDFPGGFLEAPLKTALLVGLAIAYIPVGRWITRQIGKRSRYAKLVRELREVIQELEALDSETLTQ